MTKVFVEQPCYSGCVTLVSIFLSMLKTGGQMLIMVASYYIQPYLSKIINFVLKWVILQIC